MQYYICSMYFMIRYTFYFVYLFIYLFNFQVLFVILYSVYLKSASLLTQPKYINDWINWKGFVNTREGIPGNKTTTIY